MNFNDFNFCEELNNGLDSMGFKNPTPIQEKTIPHILNKNDIIGCAQTGTGKTAAFLLPVLDNIHKTKSVGLNTLIIVPTRELAIQIDKEAQGFSYFTSIASYPVYGGGDGMSWDNQKRALTDGTEIIVATPGKLISHLNMGYVDMSSLQHLILDEADRMLDMGFHDDIMRIVKFLPEKRQTLMFSATMPPNIRTLARKLLKNPEQINIAIAKPADGILQAAYLTFDDQKIELVKHLVKGKKNLQSVLIFSSTKSKVKSLARELSKLGLSVEPISSDLEQQEREEVLSKFKARNVQILVATDVLSRGIDIKGINLIINFDVPQDAADYVHRVGRTARADETGVAITFINEDDQNRFGEIERLIEREVVKSPLPAYLGAGPEYKPNKWRRTFRKNSYGKKKFRKR